jgi:hypothetical protein
MPAEPKSILVVIFAVLALAATVVYSLRHPETGDDFYETQAL